MVLDRTPPSPGPYSCAATIRAHERAITALRFAPDASLLLSAGADGWLHFWQHVRGFKAHRSGINDISISPDSLYLATASDDHTSDIHLLHPTSGYVSHTKPRAIRHLAAHSAPILSVAFSPKSNLLATGSFDESVIIWDVSRGLALRQLPAHADAVWCVAWDPEGGMVLTGSADGLIRLWDASTGQCLKTLDNDTNSPVSHAAFAPSASYLYAATLSSTLRIYNIHTGKVIKSFRAPAAFVSEKFPCPTLIFEGPKPLKESEADKMEVDEKPQKAGQSRKERESNAWIMTGSENGKIIIWNVQTKAIVQVIEGYTSHQSSVLALAVSPDGRTIASGSLEYERSIKIWKTNS
ncbi:chromatin binding protein [Cryptococcus wingfieldii CBS 7118]|uniref:Chromatin binding protein n=1 Tax=Cryptococcus wingfieldii CBS 7118 TaxID=1295528 RepID=A0A1E3J910_9TREE|nr:chromatin binding protein [Cryptococcus wingfieldii CBS 7118]ODN96411.1 chromatin binding protein [Cryptococcus wingfieldii CBS 7118]